MVSTIGGVSEELPFLHSSFPIRSIQSAIDSRQEDKVLDFPILQISLGEEGIQAARGADIWGCRRCSHSVALGLAAGWSQSIESAHIVWMYC